jgi:hypothetical protein
MQIQPGTTYGHLTVIREVERSGANRRFLCRCKCGSETTKFMNNLRGGKSRTCGCEHARTAAAGRAAVLAMRRARAQMTTEGRMCLTCDTWKTWDHFRVDPRRPEGRYSNCIQCGRYRNMRAVYGISRAEWEQLRDEQQSRCALCGDTGEDSKLFIDHDHACCPGMRGQTVVRAGCKNCIRGLLCDHCNRVLGRIEQKPLMAARFADYLTRRPLAVQ